MSALLIVVCVLPCTGCSVAGKYINTSDSSSYIELYIGSNESSGSGYASRVYVSDLALTGALIYSNDTVYVKAGSIRYAFSRSQISVNKTAKSITFKGYTYKKKFLR